MSGINPNNPLKRGHPSDGNDPTITKQARMAPGVRAPAPTIIKNNVFSARINFPRHKIAILVREWLAGVAIKNQALMPHIVFLSGVPGSGKSTQAARLASDCNWTHIAWSPIVRACIEQDGVLNEKKIFSKLLKCFERDEKDNTSGVVIEGFLKNYNCIEMVKQLGSQFIPQKQGPASVVRLSVVTLQVSQINSVARQLARGRAYGAESKAPLLASDTDEGAATKRFQKYVTIEKKVQQTFRAYAKRVSNRLTYLAVDSNFNETITHSNIRSHLAPIVAHTPIPANMNPLHTQRVL